MPGHSQFLEGACEVRKEIAQDTGKVHLLRGVSLPMGSRLALVTQGLCYLPHTVPMFGHHSGSIPLPGYSGCPKLWIPPGAEPRSELSKYSRAGTAILDSQCPQGETWHLGPPFAVTPGPVPPLKLHHKPPLLPHWSPHPPRWAFRTVHLSS